MTITEEQEGLPSASDAQALAACPAKFRRCKGLPEDSAEDADQGKRMHAAARDVHLGISIDEAAKVHGLTREEVDRVEAAVEECKNILAVLLPGQQSRFQIEQRLFITLGERKIATAKPDVIAVGDAIVVVEFKFGHRAVPMPRDNLQVRWQILAVAEAYDQRPIYGVIIQPGIGGYTPCCYEAGQLELARAELVQIVKGANDPKANALPGVHCEHCKARLTCPDALAAFLPARFTLPERGLAEMPTGDLNRLLIAVELAANMGKLLKAEAIRRIGAGEVLADFELHPGRTLSRITDAQELWNRLLDVALSKGVQLGTVYPKFADCLTVGMGKLEELVADLTGTRGKALKGRMITLLEGLTEEKIGEPYLTQKANKPNYVCDD
jgi:hypothetical protein